MTHRDPIYPGDTTPIGIYVHVPFCKSRCHYCAFVSSLHDPAWEEPFTAAIIEEMDLWAGPLGRKLLGVGWTADSLYLGGGTPSLLAPERIARLIDAARSVLHLSAGAEITLEINPATATPSSMTQWREAGVNRASLGIQSLDDDELRFMGRPHTAADALRAFADLRSVGFGNISVDLIAGLPGRSPAPVVESLRRVLELSPEHISVYLFELKEGSRMAGLIESGALQPPDDDLTADLYEQICEESVQAGYRQYEISNFCLPGFESRHNLTYWQDRVWLGLGPGAHGMTGRHRYANSADLKTYVEAVGKHRLPFAEVSDLPPWIRFKDALIMGLRRVSGVDLAKLGRRYRIDALSFVQETIGDLGPLGLFELRGHVIALTQRGRLLSNQVFSRWV